MTIRADSYSSTSEVKAFTRHLLDGQSAFNSTTRPTATELERFIDRASGVFNNALSAAGFSPTSFRANTTAKLLGDDFVTIRAAEYVELTQRGQGYNDGEGSRIGAFKGLYAAATDYLAQISLGIQRAGVSKAYELSAGLTFTALETHIDRADPQDTSLEQPFARRNQFDFPKASDGSSGGSNTSGENA